MEKKQFGNSYQTLAVSIKEFERKLKWLKFLKRHRGPLNRLADIVHLDACGDDPNGYYLVSEESNIKCLRLRYRGSKTSHLDALLQIHRIEKLLQAELGECQLDQHNVSERPRGKYEGVGQLGGEKIVIQLSVPWIPCGCEIRSEQITQYTRSAGVRHYRVVCHK